MYDVIIIGAGVIGSFIARDLAKYQLNILVIEKENDVGDGTSCANSAIIHSGYDPEPNTLKAKLNVLGNQMYDSICEELDVEFERIGSLTIATSMEEVQMLEVLKNKAKLNGVEVEILNTEELFKIEPNATKNALKALFARSAGIINPFELCVALMENAVNNGVELMLNEEVVDIKKTNQGYMIKTKENKYESTFVINAAGVFGDYINNLLNDKIELRPRKGEYFVLDHFEEPFINHALFTIPTEKGKGILLTPTTSKNYLIGPSSSFTIDKEDLSTNHNILDHVLEEASKLVDFIPTNRIIRQFAGLRAHHQTNDFIINEKDCFINVLGIQSPGLASAPAISGMAVNIIKDLIPLKEKENYIPKRRPLYRLNNKSVEERITLCKENPSLGNMICRCEQVSEGEIIDAIQRNCGATTLKGIKKRVRPGAGKCQGGFCEPLVIKILAKQLKVSLEKIRLDTRESYILMEKTKEGDDNEKL